MRRPISCDHSGLNIEASNQDDKRMSYSGFSASISCLFTRTLGIIFGPNDRMTFASMALLGSKKNPRLGCKAFIAMNVLLGLLLQFDRESPSLSRDILRF
jgi:hypothetical protein